MLKTVRRYFGAEYLTNDTYGIPVDLTRLLAEEAGLSVDETGQKRDGATKERAVVGDIQADNFLREGNG
jgi:alanyl-tRNA synthetase